MLDRRRAAQILVPLFALALIAAACSSDTDTTGTTGAEPDGGAAAADGATAEDTEAGENGDTPSAGDEAPSDEAPNEKTPDERAELFSPTETDRPWDLSGGASSGNPIEAATDDNPTNLLRPELREATAAWPTDWTRQAVAIDELLLGLPRVDPRDGIPPIDRPMFEPIADATWLDEREPGALVRLDDEVRFYPLAILTRHELVNDRFGDIPVAVSFCPLCNTAVSFDRRVDGEVLRFGVSGLLRNSDLVMWDDATTSLWQQVTGEGIVGRYAGTRLELISTAIVSYGDALETFPDAWSLSTDTGFSIGYGINPYRSYSSSSQPFLFDGEPDPRFPALSRVVGVIIDSDSEGDDSERASKGYPFSVIEALRAVNDEVGGVPVAVWWGSDTADALDTSAIAEGAAIGTGIAFDRRLDGQTLTFAADPSSGAPGSDGGPDRFVDAETGSSWTLLGRAVEGPLAGSQLDPIPHRNEFWFAWASFFPEAPVHTG